MKTGPFLIALILISLLSSCTHSRSVPTGHTSEHCRATSEAEIASLFDRWNRSLASGDPTIVSANYASDSILLPTLSSKPHLTSQQKEEYFVHFLADKPSGEIDTRVIEVGCNVAIDTGHYTFFFAETGKSVPARYTFTYRWTGSEWLISSHHSSVMP